MNAKRCPDCRQFMDVNDDECYCGWKSSKINIGDHRCSYRHGSMRCPYPSTRSNSTHSNSTWFCDEHAGNLNNPKYCLEILQNAEKNFVDVMENKLDWHIKLIPEEYEKAKKEIHDLHSKLFKK